MSEANRTSIDELLTKEMAMANEDYAEPSSDPVDNDSHDEHNAEDISVDKPSDNGDSSDEYGNGSSEESSDKGESDSDASVQSADVESDEYGNEVKAEPKKTYTEEEVNARINQAVRERLARVERNQQPQQQPTQQQQQQAANAGFEYDENSSQDWQQQLKEFIRQTTTEMQQDTIRQQQQAKEAEALQAFETKVKSGMSRYKDFVEVVGAQPITDEMTMATRGMNDPAAFLYAASKREPTELQRISQINDPYVQIAEMGKLEAKLKKKPMQSKAPKPVSRMTQDSVTSEPKKRDTTIDDLIAASEREIRRSRSRFR